MDELVGHIHSCVVTDLNISEKGTGVAQKPRPVVQKQYPIPIYRVAKIALVEQVRDICSNQVLSGRVPHLRALASFAQKCMIK